LEAAIEKELERQRDLEKQIDSASASTTDSPQPTVQRASRVTTHPPPSPQNGADKNKPRESTTLASLSKPATPIAPPSPFKNMEVRDTNGDGVPDLWIYYNPLKPGEIIRQEEATKGDGRVDTWSYFKDGKLVRREVDTTGQGRPDAVFYYDNDKMAREERDETGQGKMTYRAIYQDGKLSKVEKDTLGNGRPDTWIYYDKDGETIVKEERDLNGDGSADLWTYY
jgi:hypothetical protein